MRTTLDIDEDILAAAKELARAEGKTAGQVLSDLARRALTGPSVIPPGLAEGPSTYGEDDWVTFPVSGDVVITSEHVRQIQDQIDIEDATPWDFETDAPRKFDR